MLLVHFLADAFGLDVPALVALLARRQQEGDEQQHHDNGDDDPDDGVGSHVGSFNRSGMVSY
jgi:hypothetical protein